MNLLFEFLHHLPEEQKKLLDKLKPKGTTAEVFKFMREQANSGRFNRESILHVSGITNAHFDKITSELLQKCYAFLFDKNPYDLLLFLSKKGVYAKHYYKEQKKIQQHIFKSGDTAEKKKFLRACINHIHLNMPIALKDKQVLEELCRKYVQLHTGKEKVFATQWALCRTTYHQIDLLFAASVIKDDPSNVVLNLQKLPPPHTLIDSTIQFECYWVWIYYHVAVENFESAISLAEEATKQLSKQNSSETELNILRLNMKLAELYYFTNRFQDSYASLSNVFNARLAETLPEYGYCLTKYIQICCITNHLQDAQAQVEKVAGYYGVRLDETLPVRDAISFAKYYLFAGEYKKAFHFIQLGFQKNPKAKYFQYEIELRNLQTACFFLSGEKPEAVQMCERHLKFLRSHGYSVKESNYPYFYVLTKAIYLRQTEGRQFNATEAEKWQRYQQGTYALYGKLLECMLGEK